MGGLHFGVLGTKEDDVVSIGDMLKIIMISHFMSKTSKE